MYFHYLAHFCNVFMFILVLDFAKEGLRVPFISHGGVTTHVASFGIRARRHSLPRTLHKNPIKQKTTKKSFYASTHPVTVFNLHCSRWREGIRWNCISRSMEGHHRRHTLYMFRLYQDIDQRQITGLLFLLAYNILN